MSVEAKAERKDFKTKQRDDIGDLKGSSQWKLVQIDLQKQSCML